MCTMCGSPPSPAPVRHQGGGGRVPRPEWPYYVFPEDKTEPDATKSPFFSFLPFQLPANVYHKQQQQVKMMLLNSTRALNGKPSRPLVNGSRRRSSRSIATQAMSKAVVVLKGTAGVEGTLTLTSNADGSTSVKGAFTGLEAGLHGLHVHEFGDTTNGCMSTGPHFNPFGKDHGAPTDENRHAGDLGNITVNDDGSCEVDITDKQIPLEGANNIIGRAFVIHELEDDLGKGDHSEPGTQGKTSLTTGNAGARLACGVVGLTPEA